MSQRLAWQVEDPDLTPPVDQKLVAGHLDNGHFLPWGEVFACAWRYANTRVGKFQFRLRQDKTSSSISTRWNCEPVFQI